MAQEVRHISDRIREDGFAVLRGHEEQWPVRLDRVREGIEQLLVAGWAPSFIMMFDEAWMLMHAISDVMAKGLFNLESHVCSHTAPRTRVTRSAGNSTTGCG